MFRRTSESQTVRRVVNEAPASPRARRSASNNRARIKPVDGIGRCVKSGAMGLKSPPKRHLLRTRHDWKRISQRLQAASLRARNGGVNAPVRKGSPRIARCDKIRRRAQTHSAGSSAGWINPKNLAKDLLLDNQQKRGSPLGRDLKAATVGHSGLRKMAGRNAEQGKGRIRNAGKAAARINLNRRKPVHRRSHQRPRALVFSPQASEVSAAAVSKMQPKNLARAAGIQSGLPDSESRPKLQKHLRKTCSSVARAGKTSARSKGVVRQQSAASPMLNSSGSAAIRKLKARNPAARKTSSKNRRAAVRKKLRVTRRAKARTRPKAKGRARTVEASERSSLQLSFLTLSRKQESCAGMKRLFLVLGCVAFISASAFAGDCCSGKKSKEGSKTEDSTKQSFAEAR
jgi:hypothetical protein